MVFLGIVATIIGAGVNQFFSLRYPSVHIVALVVELLAFPCGVALANILPVRTIKFGPLGSWCINPDKHFNLKEHTLITIMANVSIGFGSSDGTSIIQAASAFYGFKIETGFSILVVLCTQLLGFGVAGLSAPWLVEPARIIWPGTLSICALLTTLHSRANAVADGWKVTRLRFFLYATTAAFIWYFFPGLMFVALSYL
jgi:OPT family oligopeptide transporter